jgi:hypothetical protein
MKEYENVGSWTKLFRVRYMEVDPLSNAYTIPTMDFQE